jgi:IS5 family transposase
MDGIMPWRQLLELIEPHYPKAGKGRLPLGLEKMLRIYFLQIWFTSRIRERKRRSTTASR